MTTFLRLAALLLGGALIGCSDPKDQGGDTQTNWLEECRSDADCGPLSCHCGVCTRACTAELDCDGAPVGVECRAPDSAEVQSQCGGSASEGLCLGPSVAPRSTVGSFCEDYFGAVCHHLADCGCSAEASTNCTDDVLASCSAPGNAFEEIEALVAAGELRFDATAATALVAKIRTPETTCEDQISAAGFDSYSARSFGGVFVGTHDEGESCVQVDDKQHAGTSVCAPGLLCLEGADGTSTCARLAGPGEACPVLATNPDSTCLDRRVPDRDGEFESAFASLTCIPTTAGSATGTCRTDAPNGSPCDHYQQCESGRCDFDTDGTMPTCAPKGANGAPCSLGFDCESGRCVLGSPTLCAAALPDGSECASDADCETGTCDLPTDGSSGPGVCGPVTTAPLLPIGAACTENAECLPGTLCDSGHCAAPFCEDFVY